MTRNFRFKYLVPVSMVYLLTACEAIFILDPIDPRLPKYTEDGNAVAGALVNDQTWKSVVTSNFDLFYPEVYNSPKFYSFPNDSLVIVFEGDWGTDNEYLLQFSLVGYDIQEYQDLLNLEGIKIPLDGVVNKGMVNAYEVNEGCRNGKGQLYIKSVRLIPELDRFIFAGTFGFTIEDQNCETIKVEYGRFDYRVGESNFW